MKYMLFKAMCIAIAAGLLFTLNQNNDQPVMSRKDRLLKNTAGPERIPSAIGTRDDPNGRAEYEFKRVRDPKTNIIPDGIRKKEVTFAGSIPRVEQVLSKRSNVNTFDWRHRGPYNVGGRTRAFAFDVSEKWETTFLAGGVSGGMWKSTNNGNTWLKTTGSDQLHSVSCIVQDTREGKTNNWYYGTGEYSGNSASASGAFFSGDGIFKSTDNGESWELLDETSTNYPQGRDQDFDYVWNIVIDTTNSVEDEIYAATAGGIYRSLDGGSNWEKVLPGVGNYADIVITSTGVVYASSSTGYGSSDAENPGIFRSETGDLDSWVNIIPENFPTVYRRIVMDIAPSNDNIVYFLGNTPNYGFSNDTEPVGVSREYHSFWKYNYLSGDGSGSGGRWEERSDNLPDYDNNLGDYMSQYSYDMLVKVYPQDTNIVFIGGLNLYRSDDAFSTTENTNWIGGYHNGSRLVEVMEDHHPDQHGLVFSKKWEGWIYSTHDGGISKNRNALYGLDFWGSWITLNKGYFTTQYYTIAIDPAWSGDENIIGGMQDNGTYWNDVDDQTNNWIRWWSGDGAYCAFSDSLYDVYASSQYGSTIRWTLNDEGVVVRTQINPDISSSALFVNPFILDPNDNKTIYMAGGQRLFRNLDINVIPMDEDFTPKTEGWEVITTGMTIAGRISAIAVSKTPANVVYFGTEEGEIFRIDSSTAGSPQATDIYTGKGFPSGGYVNCVAVDPYDADRAFAVFSNYELLSIFYTENGGQTWTAVSGNLEDNLDGSGTGPSVRWIAILPDNGNYTYFAGTSTGLYSTTEIDGMNTVWAQEGASSIGNVVVDMVLTREIDGEVVIATHGTGVYSRDFTTPVEPDVINIIPDEYELLQNYPNPFNPTTTISFNLPKAERVTVEMFNMLGQKVRTLVSDDLRAPGTNRIMFDGLNDSGARLASGVYVYRLRAGSFTKSKRMVMIK
ncbi:MAG: T9SS type A sorting domain-containing protein [bacterium]|nr:T9SS type A sorting domain-containing protein [bacterium]